MSDKKVKTHCEDNSTDNNSKGSLILTRLTFLALSILGLESLIVIIALFSYVHSSKVDNEEITNKNHNKIISSEDLKTLEENNWNIPCGSNAYFNQDEIKFYGQKIALYKTISYQAEKNIFDHYEYEYIDNEDGTVTENRIPKYKTVYETVYEEVPIYVNVPKYDINYHYEIDK